MIAGMRRSGADFGLRTRFIEALDPSSYANTLSSLGANGTTLVAIVFPDFEAAVKSVAPRFPNTKFLFLYADPYKPKIANVRTVFFDIPPATYLAGVLAAHVTKTKKVAMLNGMADPTVSAQYHGYVAGVKSVDPTIQVKGPLVGSYEDPTKGAEVARALFNDGADVLLTNASGSNTGVPKLAHELGRHVIYDTTLPAGNAETIMGVAFQHYGLALYDQVRSALKDPRWAGGPTSVGLKEGIMGVQLSPAFLQQGAPEVVARVKAAAPILARVREQIISGAVKVPNDTSPI
jgi:basic membrane protein A and related proteins